MGKRRKISVSEKKKIGERSEPRVTVQLASLAEPGPRLPLRIIMNWSQTHKLLKRDAGTFQVCIFRTIIPNIACFSTEFVNFLLHGWSKTEMCSAENKGDQEFEKSISQNIIDHQVYRN